MNSDGTLGFVSFGEPMVEFSQISRVDKTFAKGFGGDTLNCVVAGSRMGARTKYISAVGNDSFGTEIIEFLKMENIDVSSVIIEKNGRTGVYFISQSDHDHHFDYYRDVSSIKSFRSSSIKPNDISEAKFFHTSGITLALHERIKEAAWEAVDIAKNSGTKFVFDANIRPLLWGAQDYVADIQAFVSTADIFLISEEDSRYLLGDVDMEVCVEWAFDLGAKSVVFKRGARGACYFDSKEQISEDAIVVSAKDTTGAGDCFAGALMASLSMGEDISMGMKIASTAARLACRGYGGTNSIPYHFEIRSRLHR